MNRKAIIIIFFTLVSIYCYTQNIYGIKSCKIEYVFSTPLHKGTKTVIFDDSGRIVKEVAVFQVDTLVTGKLFSDVTTKRTTFHALSIKTIDSVYSIDMDSLTGSGRPTINIPIAPGMFSAIKKVGEGVFIGKECDIMDFHGVKIWTWKGIPLKKELPSEENGVLEYATSVEESYIIKEDEFKVPKGIRIQ